MPMRLPPVWVVWFCRLVVCSCGTRLLDALEASVFPIAAAALAVFGVAGNGWRATVRRLFVLSTCGLRAPPISRIRRHASYDVRF